MMHSRRRWCLSEVDSAETLAHMLTQRTWTLCSAFFIRGHPNYSFLNDATCEDGAAEFSVLKKLANGTFVQIESITMSWCTLEEALVHLQRTLAGEYDANSFVRTVEPRIDTPEEHCRCGLCA